jgi:deoxyxylulose-5-phosphate synthase
MCYGIGFGCFCTVCVSNDNRLSIHESTGEMNSHVRKVAYSDKWTP